MSKGRAGNLFLNVLLAGLGVAVLVLLYAFVAHSFVPPPIRRAPKTPPNWRA